MDIVERLRESDNDTEFVSPIGGDLRLTLAWEAAEAIELLRLAEEGAKEAFGHVVQQKRDLEAECKRLRGLLDGAYDTIRRNAATPNDQAKGRGAGFIGGASLLSAGLCGATDAE